MQDFTKSPKVANSNTALPNKEEKWLTKDRFWNFVFWFGMSGGWSFASFIRNPLKMQTLSNFVFWGTPVLLMALLISFNRTKFIKVLTFANSEGKVLTEEQRPYMILPAVFAGLGLAAVLSITILNDIWRTSLFANSVLLLCLFSGVSLYFIYKDCPISILLNPKFWTVDGHPNIALLRKVKKNINED